jgi:hypothetical protein
MKEIFVGIGKAILFIVALLMTSWILNGFNALPDADIAIQLAVGIILFVFIEREEKINKYEKYKNRR